MRDREYDDPQLRDLLQKLIDLQPSHPGLPAADVRRQGHRRRVKRQVRVTTAALAVVALFGSVLAFVASPRTTTYDAATIRQSSPVTTLSPTPAHVASQSSPPATTTALAVPSGAVLKTKPYKAVVGATKNTLGSALLVQPQELGTAPEPIQEYRLTGWNDLPPCLNQLPAAGRSAAVAHFWLGKNRQVAGFAAAWDGADEQASDQTLREIEEVIAHCSWQEGGPLTRANIQPTSIETPVKADLYTQYQASASIDNVPNDIRIELVQRSHRTGLIMMHRASGTDWGPDSATSYESAAAKLAQRLANPQQLPARQGGIELSLQQLPWLDELDTANSSVDFYRLSNEPILPQASLCGIQLERAAGYGLASGSLGRVSFAIGQSANIEYHTIVANMISCATHETAIEHGPAELAQTLEADYVTYQQGPDYHSIAVGLVNDRIALVFTSSAQPTSQQAVNLLNSAVQRLRS